LRRPGGDDKKVKTDRLRVGVVGVGHLGEYHVQKYKTIPTVDLVAVVDTNLDRAREIAQRYDTKAFGTHREILDLVDGATLSVPTEQHFDVGKDLLLKGIHLLIEKPITCKIEHADTLIRMASEKGSHLQVGHVERFNPAVVKMESMLNNPIFIESQRLSLFTVRGTDVDVVLDLMIHDLDIILHIVPSKIKEIHAVGMSVITGKTDIASVRMIFENGAVANLTANRVSNKAIRKIRIFQPDTYLSVDCLKKELSVTRLNGNFKNSNSLPQITSHNMKYPDSDPLGDQISSFVDAIIKDSEPIVTGQDGRRALEVALAIIDQIETGCKGFRRIR
jgi:predicted dehydrogenase